MREGVKALNMRQEIPDFYPSVIGAASACGHFHLRRLAGFYFQQMSLEVSMRVWKGSKQSGSKLLLMVALADFSNAEGVAWPSIKSLSERMRMSPRYVQKMLRELEQAGEIVTTARYNNSSVYQVLVGETPVQGVNSCSKPDTPVQGGGEPQFLLEVNPSSPKQSVERSVELSLNNTSAGEPAERPRNPLFDALCEVEGSNPNEVGDRGGEVARALKMIRQLAPDVTAEEIRRRAGNYRASWPGITLTASALAKHWAKFGAVHEAERPKGTGYGRLGLSPIR